MYVNYKLMLKIDLLLENLYYYFNFIENVDYNKKQQQIFQPKKIQPKQRSKF